MDRHACICSIVRFITDASAGMIYDICSDAHGQHPQPPQQNRDRCRPQLGAQASLGKTSRLESSLPHCRLQTGKIAWQTQVTSASPFSRAALDPALPGTTFPRHVELAGPLALLSLVLVARSRRLHPRWALKSRVLFNALAGARLHDNNLVVLWTTRLLL